MSATNDAPASSGRRERTGVGRPSADDLAMTGVSRATTTRRKLSRTRGPRRTARPPGAQGRGLRAALNAAVLANRATEFVVASPAVDARLEADDAPSAMRAIDRLEQVGLRAEVVIQGALGGVDLGRGRPERWCPRSPWIDQPLGDVEEGVALDGVTAGSRVLATSVIVTTDRRSKNTPAVKEGSVLELLPICLDGASRSFGSRYRPGSRSRPRQAS